MKTHVYSVRVLPLQAPLTFSSGNVHSSCKYVLNSTLCVYVCVFCTLPFSISLYVLSICQLFLHCLEHALKNFIHQGTCAVVM